MNMAKSAENCGHGHFRLRSTYWKTSLFCVVKLATQVDTCFVLVVVNFPRFYVLLEKQKIW